MGFDETYRDLEHILAYPSLLYVSRILLSHSPYPV